MTDGLRVIHDSLVCPRCDVELIPTDKSDERVLAFCHECSGRYVVRPKDWANPVTDRTFISVTFDVHKAHALTRAAALLVEQDPDLARDLGFLADAWITNARESGYRA